MRRSSMGCGARSSHHANRATPSAATANPPATSGSDQPRSGPSTIANTSAVTPATENAAPGRSSGVACGSREVGTSSAVATRARAARAALKTNSERQENASSSPPAMRMPISPAPPNTPDQTPTTRPRSSDGKALVMIDRVIGMISAAAMPAPARMAMTVPVPSTHSTATDAPAKTSRPSSRAPFRP